MTTPTGRPVTRRRSRWWIAAITFVLGIGIGVVLTGLLSSSTTSFVAASGPNVGSGSSPTAPDTVPMAAQAEVNQACLRVINEAQAVYVIISGVGEAAEEVDLQRLDDIVRRLQPIEPRLRQDLQDCTVDVTLGNPPTAPPSPQGSASPPPSAPSASPTR